ncbi:Protein CBG12893 [Caenorhabditis briggsae]|uniref:Protein CBG12893 n=1 Tax=Caenorhabditis briggsae TaxID=6238 RepID=A8XGL7_CAEBR|nr:Protein CBG12893 [Caenorhabditis briggsae]CAP31791.1 Protein CBG12893 [Caenorhabditis briggsae]
MDLTECRIPGRGGNFIVIHLNIIRTTLKKISNKKMMQVTIGHYGVMNRKTRMTEVYQILYVSSRQSERELVSQTMQSAIGHMLNYIRDYHLDIRTGSLESCKSTKVTTAA